MSARVHVFVCVLACVCASMCALVCVLVCCACAIMCACVRATHNINDTHVLLLHFRVNGVQPTPAQSIQV